MLFFGFSLGVFPRISSFSYISRFTDITILGLYLDLFPFNLKFGYTFLKFIQFNGFLIVKSIHSFYNIIAFHIQVIIKFSFSIKQSKMISAHLKYAYEG